MALVKKLMARTGKTEEEVVQGLAVMLINVNTVEDEYKKDGVQKLKDMGMINSDHAGNEPISYSTFGLMMDRFKKTI